MKRQSRDEQTTPIANLFLRIPHSAGTITTIVDAHRKVIDHSHSVWFGIRGRFSNQRYTAIKQQLTECAPTCLYLAQLSAGHVEAYRGTVVQVSDHLPVDEKHLLPAYYMDHRIFAFMSLWMKIESFTPIHALDLKMLTLASSGVPILNVLGHNMCSKMWVVGR